MVHLRRFRQLSEFVTNTPEFLKESLSFVYPRSFQRFIPRAEFLETVIRFVRAVRIHLRRVRNEVLTVIKTLNLVDECPAGMVPNLGWAPWRCRQAARVIRRSNRGLAIPVRNLHRWRRWRLRVLQLSSQTRRHTFRSCIDCVRRSEWLTGSLRCQQQHVSVQRGATPFGRSRQRQCIVPRSELPIILVSRVRALIVHLRCLWSATEVLCQGLELVDGSSRVGRWLSLFEDCSVAAVSVSVLDFFSLSLLSAPDARASSSFAWSCLASTTEELGFSSEADSTASSFDFASRYCCCARSSSPFIEAVRASLTSR